VRTEAPHGHSPRRGFGTPARVIALAVTLASLTLAAPPIAQAQTDPGSIGIRLIDIPASSTDDSRARQYIVDHLEPGSTIERRFEISNSTPDTSTVEVYTSAAGIVDGTFLGEPGHSSNDLSSRTSLAESSMVIPAHSTGVNTITVSIPGDAAPGEQYAALWVEARSASGNTIETVNRVGIRMYVSVGGSNPPATSFTIDSLTASRKANGSAAVTATISNTGGRAIDAAELKRVGASLTAGPYASDEGVTIAPGDSGRLTVVLNDDIDTGPWDAAVTVTSGTLEMQSQAALTFPDSGTGDSVVAEVTTNHGSIWGIGIALVLLAIAAALVLIRRSRARKSS
jgi:hypothetical protein